MMGQEDNFPLLWGFGNFSGVTSLWNFRRLHLRNATSIPQDWWFGKCIETASNKASFRVSSRYIAGLYQFKKKNWSFIRRWKLAPLHHRSAETTWIRMGKCSSKLSSPSTNQETTIHIPPKGKKVPKSHIHPFFSMEILCFAPLSLRSIHILGNVWLSSELMSAPCFDPITHLPWARKPRNPHQLGWDEATGFVGNKETHGCQKTAERGDFFMYSNK